MKKSLIGYLIFLTTALILIAGCSSATVEEDNAKSSDGKDSHTYHAENGDLRESTASAEELPVFVHDKHKQVKIVYGEAAKHKELLEWIPCYCGCAESGNHQNVYDCFVYENRENGEVVWDDHGTKCGTCLDTAAESIQQYNDGKTIKQIRDYIDDKYQDSYGEPTPTDTPENEV
ncbi:hypothetical protein CVD25_06750 [Bacillus canaveralius]|uniref:Lipoprotein n=1 Tax=Bacillus canaveralius TaxID=1403243 RepID=A0A2N5GJ24_9BACI|nr:MULTISPECIES: PCYCGC motif-containing (lipo)protein [Bacillus]PLR81053.1 hypothetical protein CU635_16205 [Bacillus canaveralius]PLR82754.1 hypothetical protein CVD23_16290 [Bacillus sp. V33-4]PLR98973.1 hypothetical protein CVD25_06750 [Bacillus canaveralius]